MSCNKVRAKLKLRQAIKESKKSNLNLNYMLLLGSGSALRWIFTKRYKVGACPGCHLVAAAMDRTKPEEILNNLTVWAERVHKNTQQQKWTIILDFVDTSIFGLRHYESLIREAVQLHLSEVTKKEELS